MPVRNRNGATAGPKVKVRRSGIGKFDFRYVIDSVVNELCFFLVAEEKKKKTKNVRNRRSLMLRGHGDLPRNRRAGPFWVDEFHRKMT